MASTFELFFAAGDDVMGMLCTTVNEVIWFAAGFLVFRLAIRCGLLPAKLNLGGLVDGLGISGTTPKNIRGKVKNLTSQASASICADSNAGKHKAVLATWHCENHTALAPAALEAVALALVRLEPDNATQQLVDHLRNNAHLATPATVHSMVMASAREGRPDIALELIESMDAAKLYAAVSTKTRHHVVGSFAAQASAGRVRELLAREDHDSELWCSGANFAVRGFLEGGHASLALQLVQDMQRRGAALHESIINALLNAACTSNEISLPEVLGELKETTVPADSAAAAMVTCLKLDDLPTALHLQEHLRSHQPPIPFAVLEPLVKLAAKHDEQMALEIFREMRNHGMYLSEGLCGLLLSRCGEVRHMDLAEAVQQYLRENHMTTLATYKTLMKVYASCNLLDRACDLYEDICADGIAPDSVMRGCLVKFAVKCGRDDLSEQLLKASEGQTQDPQNYIWLIRAAGQKHDADRAIFLLRKLQASKQDAVEAHIFNCVLDACMASSKIDEAETIFFEMRQKHIVTIVTYNTLIKGYAGKGDFSRARRLLAEMQSSGFQADQASFNSLISAAVSSGKYDQVWTVFDEMQKAGLEADNFTLAILMKLVRKSNSRRDTLRALAVLDTSSAEICKDDVLLNSVLDACIHLKDTQRLSWVLQQFEGACLKPSVQNYGLIIKAYATLKRVDKCWSVWQDMTQTRKLLPSDVALSCMLDAMVTAGQTEEAVALFREWQGVVPPNTIIYSNLIKGFASVGDAERAMEMYHELKSHGLPMNIVAYSTLIDAQAKAGDPIKAKALLQQMEEDGCKPNTITYSSLLKAYCVKGELEGALEVFDTMVTKGLKPDTVVFNTLLDGAVRCSQFNVCDQVLAEMSNAGVEASCFTLSIVVKMWGKRRKLDRAFATVRDFAKAANSKIDSKLCTCLISACFHNQQPKRALEAIEEMKSWPRCDGPDSGTYEALLDSMLRCGLLKEAATVAIDAIHLASAGSIKPLSVGHLRHLFRALQQKGKPSQDLLQELRAKLQAASLPMP